MEDQDPYTVVTINRERLTGLKLRACKIRPKTSVAAFLDDLLEKAGIPCVKEQELEKEVQAS